MKHFPKDRLSAIEAVVNLECLGLAPTKVWAHVASPELLDYLVKVTRYMHADLQAVNVDKVGNNDTQAFRDKKLPVITIHSVTQETLSILHSGKDNLTAIRPDDLYNSYFFNRGIPRLYRQSSQLGNVAGVMKSRTRKTLIRPSPDSGAAALAAPSEATA